MIVLCSYIIKDSGGGGESAHHTLILDIRNFNQTARDDSKRCDSIAHSHCPHFPKQNSEFGDYNTK
jgi:hypothetical protein